MKSLDLKIQRQMVNFLATIGNRTSNFILLLNRKKKVSPCKLWTKAV